MKPGDKILIRAKLINVRESDNEATVGFDATTTVVVVPLGVVKDISEALAYTTQRETSERLWRISQAVKLQQQNDLAGLQQFYDYVKGVLEGGST